MAPPKFNISSEQREFLAKLRADVLSEHPEYGRLYEILERKFEGSIAVPTAYEEDFEKIMSRGRFFGKTADRVVGDASQCHRNSCMLWSLNRKNPPKFPRIGPVRICTGYALSKGGTWSQHSWVVNESDIPIETTVPRLEYFWFVMTDAEAADFDADNW